jgi:hypothetical protein
MKQTGILAKLGRALSKDEKVPEDVPDDWHPAGYTSGPDDPGPVTSVHDSHEPEGPRHAE